MKGPAGFRRILFSTWFLALIPALIIFIFLAPIGSEYSISFEREDSAHSLCKYEDLDSDNNSEFISSGKGIPYYYMVVQDNNMKVYDQWNLTDSLHSMISDFVFGNYDHDLFKEIYVFTYKEDSLFLNVNEFMDKGGLKLDRKFITEISYIKGELTTNALPAGFFDENGDGLDEFYFILSTGFGLQPRRAYFYDIANSQLKSSQLTGMICQNPKFNDVEGDGRPEIFGMLSASGNYHTKVPYSDSSTWLMVFNDKLEFEFPPVEFRGYTNKLKTYSFSGKGVRGYVLSHSTGAVDTTILKPRIMLYSTDGILLADRLFQDLGFAETPEIEILRDGNSDRIFLFGESFMELDEKLDIVKQIKSPFMSRIVLYQEDITGDSDKELLLHSETEEKLVIYGDGFNKYCELKIKTPSHGWAVSHKWSGDNKHTLYFDSGIASYYLSIDRNKFYYLGYLAYPGIYMILYLFIFLIKRVTTEQIEQRESMKRRLLSLQLQGIKSQLDPHFTFNALNSVASLVYLDDRQAAYDYLNKFTHLIRRLLNDAERIYRSLEEELEFVTTYLDLEKLRFGDKFSYAINIGEGVSRCELVPKLVLQTFAENAIKHGIIPREDGGRLKISVQKESDYLILLIEDNGIGRAAAAGQSKSTGKGLRLTDEFYEILNKVAKRPIEFVITDLYDNSGGASGTRVEVRVPDDLQLL